MIILTLLTLNNQRNLVIIAAFKWEVLLNGPFGTWNVVMPGDPIPKLFTAYTCNEWSSISSIHMYSYVNKVVRAQDLMLLWFSTNWQLCMVKRYFSIFLSPLRDHFWSSYCKGWCQYQAIFSVRSFKGNKMVKTTQSNDIKSHKSVRHYQVIRQHLQHDAIKFLVLNIHCTWNVKFFPAGRLPICILLSLVLRFLLPEESSTLKYSILYSWIMPFLHFTVHERAIELVSWW